MVHQGYAVIVACRGACMPVHSGTDGAQTHTATAILPVLHALTAGMLEYLLLLLLRSTDSKDEGEDRVVGSY